MSSLHLCQYFNIEIEFQKDHPVRASYIWPLRVHRKLVFIMARLSCENDLININKDTSDHTSVTLCMNSQNDHSRKELKRPKKRERKFSISRALLFSLIIALPSTYPYALVRDLLYAPFSLSHITSYVFLADQIRLKR